MSGGGGCRCHGAGCHLHMPVTSDHLSMGGELLATVTMNDSSTRWVTGSLLWPPAVIARIPIPRHWVQDRQGRSDGEASAVVATTVTLQTVNMTTAFSWDQRHHPFFNATRHPQRVLDHRKFDLSLCRMHPKAWAPAPCGFIDGDEEGSYWSLLPQHHERWVPGCIGYRRETSLSQFRGVRILLLGDSQMRTLFSAMLRVACPGWPYMDYASERRESKSFCKKRSELLRNATPATRYEDICACGGRLVVYRTGCWDGGAEFIPSEGGDALAVSYADMHDVNDFRFVEWPHVNLSRFDVVLVGHGLHDSNSDGVTVAPRARHMFAFLRRTFPSSAILNVGVWATDATKRGLGYEWAASLVKNAALSRSFAAAAAEHSVRTVSLFRMSLSMRSRSFDGVHLLWPLPLKELARLLWHNVANVTGAGHRKDRSAHTSRAAPRGCATPSRRAHHHNTGAMGGASTTKVAEARAAVDASMPQSGFESSSTRSSSSSSWWWWLWSSKRRT